MLVMLPAALLGALALAASTHLRLALLIFGGLLVFQSSDELTSTKLLFFAGAALAALVALVRAQRFAHEEGYRMLAPLVHSSIWFSVVVLASLPVSIVNDTPQRAWLRDIAPYLLLAAVPFFAFDAQRALSERGLRRLLLVAGALGALSFSAGWLSRRGLVEFTSVGLATFLLGAALFAYAIAAALEGDRHRLRWLAVASLIVAGFLATATRSTAVLLAAPLAVVLASGAPATRRWARLAIVLPAATLLVAAGVQSFVRASGADREALSARTQLIFQTGGAIDQSYLERRTQTDAAWEVFRKYPLLGAGPGYPISWVDSSGLVVSGPNLDTPVSYLAKFGLVGVLPLLALVWGYWRALARMHAATGERTVPQLALIGFAGILVGSSVLSVPFEDKGLASALVLLFALAAREVSAHRGLVP
jgi:hypothetical protein